jgi:hypothetical protein
MDDDLNRGLSALGGAVAEVSDRASDAAGRAAIATARRSFLAPPPALRAPLLRPRTLALLAAACGALLVVLSWAWRSPRSLSFQVAAAAARPGVVGEWVAAEPGAPVALRFSEGSTLGLAPGARMRVTTTNPRGADVLIERGAVHAVITHAERAARWALRAGPFEVRVTGTVFDASWDPVTESFELIMEQGSVVVTGPLIPPDRAVVAGERLRVSVRDARMELTIGPQAATLPEPAVTVGPQAIPTPAEPAPNAAEPPAAPGVEPRSPREATRPAATGAEPGALAESSWKALAAAGKYRDALAAVEAAGFERELSRASASELLLLADAARLGGSPARARAALLAARARGVRGHTAFLLGKIAADQGGSSGDAGTWMETYLREQPGGSFAEQALGRIVELSRRDPASSARAAERYLARYPSGAHAPLARSLVAAGAAPRAP